MLTTYEADTTDWCGEHAVERHMCGCSAVVARSASSWSRLDLAETIAGLRDGTITRPMPTLGQVSGGSALFYSGRVNGLAGESGSGKTWTALAACVQELAEDAAAMYVDLEDDAAGIVGRLLDLGADSDAIRERFAYVSPAERFDVVARESVAELLATLRPSLVVIDSTGEGLALDGANPNADEDVASWFRRLPRWVAERGPGVLVLDHVTKADAEGLWPIGSQRKRAAITGAQYMQRVVRPFARDSAGHAKLVCAKDRGGHYRTGQHVADLRVTPASEGVAVELVAAAERDPGSPWRPTALMDKLSRAIETASEPLTRNDLHRAVPGKTDAKTGALEVLISEGYVMREPGPNRSQLHTSVKPYRQAEDPRSDAYAGGEHPTPEVLPDSVVGAPAPIGRGAGEHHSPVLPGSTGGAPGSTAPECPKCLPDGGLCIDHWKAAVS